ncbi:MAG: hypothetical protein V1787_00385 [Candidatus Micrarchaeota archaeon]
METLARKMRGQGFTFAGICRPQDNYVQIRLVKNRGKITRKGLERLGAAAREFERRQGARDLYTESASRAILNDIRGYARTARRLLSRKPEPEPLEGLRGINAQVRHIKGWKREVVIDLFAKGSPGHTKRFSDETVGAIESAMRAVRRR